MSKVIYKMTDGIYQKVSENSQNIFNEQSLREDIVRVWGPAGAHVDVFDMLLKKVKSQNKITLLNEEEINKKAKKFLHLNSKISVQAAYKVGYKLAQGTIVKQLMK